MITALLSLAIFAAYLFFVLKYVGKVPQSLSETYYLLGNKQYYMFPDPLEMEFNRLRASLFTFMMWAISITLLPAMLDITPESRQFLAFLALSAICFVGAAPNFKDEFEGNVHKASAVIAAICGLLWVVFATDNWPMIILSAFCVLVAALRTNTAWTSRVFWLEMIAFGSVYLAAIFQTL